MISIKRRRRRRRSRAQLSQSAQGFLLSASTTTRIVCEYARTRRSDTRTPNCCYDCQHPRATSEQAPVAVSFAFDCLLMGSERD